MGLNYNMWRNYDPAVGRYIESDPIGVRGGANTYAFGEGAPTMNFDETGLAVQGYGGSAERSDQIAAVGPWNAWLAHNEAVDAFNMARVLEGMHNGPADAFRHCIWSCLMTQSIGVHDAEMVANIHEWHDTQHGQPTAEFKMDTANNAVGRQCGLVKSKKNCPQKCMDKLRAGELFGLGGVPMKAPE